MTSCRKFSARSSVLATDGFIVYDIQDEAGRTNVERPFPFRKTLDPAWYGSLFPGNSGKQTVVYKCVVETSLQSFKEWLDKACDEFMHNSFVLVGAPTSSRDYKGATLKSAAEIVRSKEGATFGCVAIAERHTSRGREHLNMMRKQNYGAKVRRRTRRRRREKKKKKKKKTSEEDVLPTLSWLMHLLT